MVRKTRGGYVVFSHKTGKRLGRVYKTKTEATKRLRQIQFLSTVEKNEFQVPRPSHTLNPGRLSMRLNTPLKVQRWLKSLDYNHDETMHTLHGVTRREQAHCLEGALSAAALLEPQGYPPLILDLESVGPLDHTVFLFKRKGRWGSVGMSHDIGLHGRRPVFRSVEALVKSYIIPYIDHQSHLTGWGVLDLRTLKKDDWRDSKKSVWYVERALQHMPHHRLHTSPVVIKRWRERYKRFHKKYPRRQPDYFPNQYQWM